MQAGLPSFCRLLAELIRLYANSRFPPAVAGLCCPVAQFGIHLATCGSV